MENGYKKIVQSGDELEVYVYEKKINVHRSKRNYSRNKRSAKKEDGSRACVKYRTKRSIQRARQSFFRLVAANLYQGEKPTFATFTFYESVSLSIAYRALSNFFQSVRKIYPGLSYIAVPEWQKRGTIHFHALVWGFAPDDVKKERRTRNYQRLWARGYVDLRIAENRNKAIAGYMAKYLVKGLEDSRLANNRAFSCSRNVKRPFAAGSNSMAEHEDLIIPTEKELVSCRKYDTMWLGSCSHYRYQIKQ
jgi:hypothetical protein